MNRVTTFLKEVKVELSKVSWPSRQQLMKYTLTVVGITLFLAVFLGSLDSAFAYLVNILVN